MKSTYIVETGNVHLIAISDLVDNHERGKIITRINVPQAFRGNGLGSKLLKMITDDADKEQIHLYLVVKSSGELDDDQLSAWYQRNGFCRVYGAFHHRMPKQNLYPETLPAVLYRPNVKDGSLSLARVLKNALDLISRGDFEGVEDDAIELVIANLQICVKSIS